MRKQDATVGVRNLLCGITAVVQLAFIFKLWPVASTLYDEQSASRLAMVAILFPGIMWIAGQSLGVDDALARSNEFRGVDGMRAERFRLLYGTSWLARVLNLFVGMGSYAIPASSQGGAFAGVIHTQWRTCRTCRAECGSSGFGRYPGRVARGKFASAVPLVSGAAGIYLAVSVLAAREAARGRKYFWPIALARGGRRHAVLGLLAAWPFTQGTAAMLGAWVGAVVIRVRAV